MKEEEIFITAKGKEKLTFENPIEKWSRVERYLSEKTSSGLFMALIEAEKLLNLALSEKKFPGKDLETKISFAKERFSDIKALHKARKIKQDILEKIDFNLTSLDIEEALASYKQAIIDITQDPKKLGLTDRLILYTDYYFPYKLGSFKRFFLYFFLFFLSVWFLAHSSWGSALVKFFVFLADIIFSWALAVILVVLGLIITIIGSILYFEKRKRMK